MEAMVLHRQAAIEGSPLSREQMPDPVAGAGQVRVKVRCCAVCRTDLHVIEGDLPAHALPVVPGHQVVGIVDQLGAGARRLKMGQRVGIAWLRETCGVCDFCRRDEENLCPKARFTGYDADGGFATHAVVDDRFAYELPEGLPDVEVAPLLCSGIIGYRSLKRACVPSKGTLALVGFGSSAHIVLQIALPRGYKVYVVSREKRHQGLAREMGAAWVGAHPSELPVRVQSAILFAPAGELVPPVMEKLERGGTLSLAGIYMSAVPELDYEKHLFYERQIRSVTCNTRADGRELLAEAAAIPIRPHVTEYPLGEANRALQDLKQGRVNGTGVLVV